MEETKFDYPPVGFHFKVEFLFSDQRAKSEVHFQEVSGLSKEMTTEEFSEGGENRFVYRFPKGTKYPNLVLKRGLKVDSKIVDWVRDAIDHFDFSPVTLSISLLNPDGNPLIAWTFVKCWPLKWSTSDLKAQENSIVIETLELNYQSYTQQKA